jgi:hypothetical protein
MVDLITRNIFGEEYKSEISLLGKKQQQNSSAVYLNLVAFKNDKRG